MSSDPEIPTTDLRTLYHKGQEILVKAWWDRGRIVKCLVSTVYENFLYATHIGGNPHSKCITLDVIQREPKESPPESKESPS